MQSLGGFVDTALGPTLKQTSSRVTLGGLARVPLSRKPRETQISKAMRERATLTRRIVDLARDPEPLNEPLPRALAVEAPDNEDAQFLLPGPRPEQSKPRADHDIVLTAEQEVILKMVLSGQSLLFSGAAGTGKSVVTRRCRDGLIAKYEGDDLALGVAASTGIAAVNIGGRSLHSLAGIGRGAGTKEDMLDKVLHNPKAKEIWLGMKTLIVDEISMVPARIVEALDYIGRHVRENEDPFGGIQLVFVGDFTQLPPMDDWADVQYAFQARCWLRCVPKSFELRTVFRQTDSEFIKILNEVRMGSISAETEKCIQSWERDIPYSGGPRPIKLHAHRFRVDDANKHRLELWSGTEYIYRAEQDGKEEELQRLPIPAVLTLKVGIPVMLLKNFANDPGLVNGRRGRIVTFLTKSEWSKCRELVSEASKAEAEAHRHKTEVERIDGKADDDDRAYPVVEFEESSGRGVHQVLVQAEEFYQNWQGEQVAYRYQLPLAPCWALSIHKAQGQSFDEVIIDLEGTFEYGQLYVALSRAKSLAGLQVLKFHIGMAKTHPEVIRWLRSLLPVPVMDNL